MARMVSLAEMRRKQEEEEERKAKGQEFFAGGIDRRGGGSGLAVQDPPDDNDVFGRIVRRAKENSAEDTSSSEAPENAHRIVLWQDGFQVNGGDFRANSDPANREFLTALAAGYVPEELRRGEGTHHVALEDRRSEKYTPPPPPAYVAFGGDAMAVGSAASSETVFTKEEFSQPVHVDEGQPSTIIQVKLLDGKKIKVK